MNLKLTFVLWFCFIRHKIVFPYIHRFNYEYLVSDENPEYDASYLEFIYSQRGHPLIVLNNYLYRKNRGRYWRCLRCTKHQCRARLIFSPKRFVRVYGMHTHGKESEKIEWGRKVCNELRTTYLKELDLWSKIKLPVRQPHFKTDDSSSPSTPPDNPLRHDAAAMDESVEPELYMNMPTQYVDDCLQFHLNQK